MHVNDLLKIAVESSASDLHLKVGNYPHLRVDGELVPLTDQPRVSAEDMLQIDKSARVFVGAGHNVHCEQPEELWRAISTELA